jgi:hypothetical protein
MDGWRDLGLRAGAHPVRKQYQLRAVIPVYVRTNKIIHGKISGSHGVEFEDDCLLGCCAV